MNSDIKAIVEQYPSLRLQVNKGERHRIMRTGTARGSLWIAPRGPKGVAPTSAVGYYNVIPTGEAEALLRHFLHSHFGPESGVDYRERWKWWNITELGDVAKIIQRYAGPS